MKKFFLIVFIGFSISSFAQRVSGSSAEIKNLVSKNWDVDHALMSGLIIKRLPPKVDFEINLTKDGTFQITKIDNQIVDGTWVFNSKLYYIALMDEEKVIGKISKLQPSSMELILISEKDNNSNLSDIMVVLKPN